MHSHRNVIVSHCPVQIKLGLYEKQLQILLKQIDQESNSSTSREHSIHWMQQLKSYFKYNLIRIK